MLYKRSRYGYKVCYREAGNNFYVRHFMTYTYSQAKSAKESYMSYPPAAREDNHKLIRPKWKIKRIRREEVKAGIWREVPF